MADVLNSETHDCSTAITSAGIAMALL